MRIALNSSIITKRKNITTQTSFREITTLVYHDIFDYPLSSTELYKWKAGKRINVKSIKSATSIKSRKGYYFLKGRGRIVSKRQIREQISLTKRKIAKRAAVIIRMVPSVKMVGITGALSMNNASEDSDIDLMIITSKDALWTTRALVWITLKIFGISLRKPGERIEKDKLCLNIWLDESDLGWKKKDRNIFTAHEIAQVVPLINKDNTYKKFINDNAWVKDYWPNAVEVSDTQYARRDTLNNSIFSYLISRITYFLEPLAFGFQKSYMRKKITRETVTPTRALFHPVDWGKVVLQRFRIEG